ncbi:Protein of uncharacterised function (DUF2502) [Serratia quinivorans]|uniref:DUF2502 domain-containing protein n=1 Tax=Serratia quinivorans TaxID=137545 RepID=A0ABV3UJ55_9GAMM|nr:MULTISPECIES: DUF2502 domain-containing protein [Serratia]CAI1535561.1 Protein of uncharacterised function (DUF2502) [Serratia quinivorans]
MKKILLLVCLPLLLPVAAQADVSIDINVPGVAVHLGDQDRRGYYWDGYDWRPPQWWHEHQGRGMGERNKRGMYWDGGRWQSSPPRGYDHRGGNPFHGERDNRNDGDRHDNGNHHDNGGRDNDRGKNNDRGKDNGHGKPYPQNDNDPRR